MAKIMIFLRSKASAKKPANAIKKNAGIVNETITPDTPRLLPVFKNTETISDKTKNALAAWPIKITKERIKNSLLFKIRIYVFGSKNIT
ncbi:MAG: hypothetical protein Q7T50_03620 [Candidatus Magasanikbacteria bacterium]|nr:hypothetical protein [Candidatus Magasanikbacteria bacterium]